MRIQPQSETIPSSLPLMSSQASGRMHTIALWGCAFCFICDHRILTSFLVRLGWEGDGLEARRGAELHGMFDI